MFSAIGLPHGYSFLWNPGLLWLNVLSDSLIALAYFLIPIALVRIVRRREDVPFNLVYFCFVAFILTGGVTHVMEVVTLWHPIYWVSGAIKAATGIVSLITLWLLLRLVPVIVAIPSRADLERSDRRTESVLENSTVCAIAANSAWNIHYMNGNAEKLLKANGVLLGRTLWDAFPGQQESERAILQTVMETRQPASYEGYYLPLDLSCNVQAHPWDGGGIAVFFSDVSEQKRLQRDLDRERATRHQRVEVLAQFSAGLAHEIKNPLAIINARASDLAELAAEGTPLPVEEVTKACTSILTTSTRALRILRGLETLARDGAHDPMRNAEVKTMVELAVELVQRRYDACGIKLEAVVPKGLPLVECRDVQIGQVLMNLLNNAFDAIEASPKSERWARVQVSMENAGNGAAQRVHIDVIDGGPPLSAETREHLMEAFYTTKTMGGGMGVGLSISLAIAQDHGGSLALRECDGHTCVRLSLPVRSSVTEGIAA